MTIRVGEDGAILLEGNCGVEDAETLVRFALADPSAVVDWSGCDRAHTAVVQILLATGAAIRGRSRSAFMNDWVGPLLAASDT